MMMTMRVKQTDDGRIWFQIEEKRTTERASESAITKEKEKISEKAYDEIEGKKNTQTATTMAQTEEALNTFKDLQRRQKWNK